MRKKIVGIATVTMILAVYIGAVIAAGVPAGSQGVYTSGGNRPDLSASLPENAALDGAYENNETITSPSIVQLIQEEFQEGLDYSDATRANNHNGEAYIFTIRNQYNVHLLIPFSPALKKNGRNVAVRYLWYKLRMPVGVNVTDTWVNSGSTQIYYSAQIRQGTGSAQWYVINLGSRRVMPEGTTIDLMIHNSNAVNQTVYSYGARLLQEW
jgi:hypothetical protein